MDAVQDYEFRKAKLWYKIWQEETLLAVETDAQKKIARAENVANFFFAIGNFDCIGNGTETTGR